MAAIQELTPLLLSMQLLLVVCSAAVLTLLVSVILLRLYRRAVINQMDVNSGFNQKPDDSPPVVAPIRNRFYDEHGDGVTFYQKAMRGPWHVVRHYAIAGLVYALVFSIAARFVYPFQLGIPGFLISIWIYLWPLVPAMILIIPVAVRLQILYVVIYFGILMLLTLWAGTINDIPASRFGAITLPARSSATPELNIRLWLMVNGIPTLLVLLSFNRWARAITPLVLSFITAALSGTLVVYFALFSGLGIEVAVAASVYFDIDVRIFVLGVLLLSLLGFGALGWAISRWISRAYRNKTFNDQSLLLDALWLLFASGYAMWLILGGLVWAATAIVAFVGFKFSLRLTQKITSPSVQSWRGLTFLRVFSLGRRSEQLLENVAKYWRHIGSVQMITGPDVARSTVQPHQFLDFLSGNLVSHFVHDRVSLVRSISEWDCEPDSDGRYRINSLFCHADTWQQALPQLAQAGDMVLMDLRSFSATNAGCTHEIQHLIANVSLNSCLLIVDKTTDVPFLEGILQQAWRCLPPHSPNKTRSPSETPIHQFDSSPHALRQLVRQLCDAEA